MRHARLRSLSLLSIVALAACTSATPGWTYLPAPAATPVPSASAPSTPSDVPSSAPSQAPSVSPSGAPSASPSGSGNPAVITIRAIALAFDPTTVTAPADTPFQIEFANEDPGTPHDITIHEGGEAGPELFRGAAFNGVETRVYDVPALPVGTHAFICSVHPTTMIGTLNAQ